MSERVDRVRAVLAIGARIADPGDPLGREARARLPDVTGLSPEGVELALREHLEQEASDAELAAFVDKASVARVCRVVLSANVCTAALRAIAFAAATAPIVSVSPSRRDPVIATLLVAALSEDASFARAGGAIRIHDAAGLSEDELHVYGSDATITEIRGKTSVKVKVRGHGSGLGVAIVGGGDDLEAAATALARDVVPFDQRGCLSPRFALVAGGPARGERFAAALDRELDLLGRRVPRGELDAPARAELARYRSTLRAAGVFHEGAHHAVGFDAAPRALLLGPAVRAVHVVAAEGERANALLEPFAAHVVVVGSLSDSTPLARAWPCRVAELGRMQRPPFDGPVDLRPYLSSETG